MKKNILKTVTISRERQPIVYEKTKDGKYYCYDGSNYGTIEKAEFKELMRITSDFLMIPRDKKNMKQISLQEQHELFVKHADKIKEITSNKVQINMYKTGRDTQTSIYLSYYFLNKNNIVPDKISIDEQNIIIKATKGGALIKSCEYTGEGWKYDINSSYASTYSSDNFLIPIRQGKLEYIEFIDYEFDGTGFFRCKIEYVKSMAFKYNQYNWYTFEYILFARELNLNVELIKDTKPNAIIYTRDMCKTGRQCFGEYVDYLYPLRKYDDISPRIKSFLACIWGAFSEQDTFTLFTSKTEETVIYENKDIVSILPGKDGSYKGMRIDINLNNESNFIYDWARIKPFLLSCGRIKIGKIIQPYEKYIKRVHTDGFISSRCLPLQLSSELGGIKSEGYSYMCNIMNCNKISGYPFYKNLENEQDLTEVGHYKLMNNYIKKHMGERQKYYRSVLEDLPL
jgi:hypothetical protein